MSAASGYAPCTTPPTHGPRGDPLTSEQPDLDIDALWADYKSAGTRELRDQLIVHYSPLVKYVAGRVGTGLPQNVDQRSEEHTSELQSLMRHSYAVFCLKKKNQTNNRSVIHMRFNHCSHGYVINCTT